MPSDTIRSIRNNMFLTNIIILVIGVTFIVWPDKVSEIFVRVLGALLLVCAAFEIIKFILESKKGVSDIVTIVGGVIVGAIGLWFLLNPGWLIGMLGVIFGIIIILIGLMHLHQSLFIIKAVRAKWWISLIISILVIAFGALIIINPFDMVNGTIIMIGIALIIEAVAGFYNLPALRSE